MRTAKQSLFRSIAAVALLANLAGAQSANVEIITNRTLIDDQFIFGNNAASPPTLSQRVITAANPSLIGLGIKRTILRCNDAAVTDRFITVENFGSGRPHDGRYARVAGLTIDGMERLKGSIYGHGSTEFALSAFAVSADADGIALDGEQSVVVGVLVKNFRGAGVKNRIGGGRISHTISRDVYVGFWLPASDSALEGSFAINTRDCGVYIPARAGNIQTKQVHSYGSRVAFYDAGSYGWRSLNDTMADALICLHMEGGNEQFITNANLQHGLIREAVVRANKVTFAACQFNIARKSVDVAAKGIEHGLAAGEYYPGPTLTGKVGIEVQARGCRLDGCVVILQPYQHASWGTCVAADCAIWLNDYTWLTTPWNDWSRHANMFYFTGSLLDGDGLNGSTGIRVSGNRYGARVDVEVGSRSTGDSPLYQFIDDASRILVVDETAVMKDCQFVFRGSQPDLISNVEKYIDVPANWKPAGSNNSITIIKSDTGEVEELENQAY